MKPSSKLAPSSDVKSWRSLAFAHATNGYSVVDNPAIAPAPAELVKRSPKRARARRSAAPALLPFEDPEAQRALAHALRRIAESGPGQPHESTGMTWARCSAHHQCAHEETRSAWYADPAMPCWR